MKYQAVLFDFDYTLGDATVSVVAGFQYAFEKLGLPVPGREPIRLTVGYLLKDGYTRLSGDATEAGREEFARLFGEKAKPMQRTTTVLFPGAMELLQALHGVGCKLGVVSSKGIFSLKLLLEHLGPMPLLDLAIGGDQVERPKPNPEGLLRGIETLGLAPHQVLFCGDTVIDAETAQRAGCDFCAVLNGTTGAEAFEAFPHANIAENLPELQRWLGV